MVEQPQTRYAKGPEGNIAYQVVGDGTMDLVIVPGWISHLDLMWSDPGWPTFIGELASFARVILYDKRGTGLSDPVDSVPTLDSRADDLRCVLDAADCDRVALLGFSEGGPISVLFAATYPQRIRALVLGIDVRCGLHTGECEIRGDDIGGIAVHIGARIAALAQAGEVLVSSTVKDRVNGSGTVFQDRDTHVLKGVPGEWKLFAPAGSRSV